VHEITLGAEIARAAAVSFDVFDTLFVRPLVDPEDLFDLLGQRFDIPGFRELRCTAQVEAFREMAANGQAEITLDGIYACLRGLPGGIRPEEVRDAEYALELVLTRPNRHLWPVFLEATRQKPVVVTTDMYLPERFFVELFERHGAPQMPMFVSSERNATKRDSGALFEQVVAELGVEPGQVLHIGDNPLADVQRAREKGLCAFHYRQPQVGAKPTHAATLSASLAAALPKIADPKAMADSFYGVGYRYGGPAARGFLTWIRDRATEDRIDALFFLSRDGYILERLARRGDVTGLPPFAYLPGSRVAFTLAATLESNFAGRLDFLLSGAFGLKPCEVLERIGVPVPAARTMRELGLGDEVPLNEANMQRMRSFLLAYRHAILKVCHRNRRGLYQLLRESGIKPRMRIAVVDVGWAGSTQEALCQALARMCPVEVHGYYLVLTDTPECNARRAAMPMRAMFDKDSVGGAMVKRLYAKRVAIEQLFSAPHATVVGYTVPLGQPVQDLGRGVSPHTHAFIGEMLKGVADFSLDFNYICQELGHPPDPLETSGPILDFADSAGVAGYAVLDTICNFDAWGSSANHRMTASSYL